jgi:mannose-1-phosphate guanylyltransferase
MSTLAVPQAVPATPVASGNGAKPPWAIVLAGGEGRRLRPLTRYVCGDDRPKQFAALLGGRSLLRQTLDRVGLRIPPSRTVVVTHARDGDHIAREFARRESPECLIQPEDRGTAAAILWAAHVIRLREPDAIAAVFPSDHYVEGEAALMRHTIEVVAFVHRHPDRLVLLGAIPTEAETQYGWIEPGEPIGRTRGGRVYAITRFQEKPSAEGARACQAAGAFWNTFILVSPVATLAAIGAATMPQLSASLERPGPRGAAPGDLWAIREAFALAPRASFSRDVLERLPAGMAVAPLPASITWTDWGTPERVIVSLRRAGLQPRWLEVLAHSSLRSA